jgi:hypothetical protein
MLYYINSNLADFQYLWIDMFHVLPLAITSCVPRRSAFAILKL